MTQSVTIPALRWGLLSTARINRRILDGARGSELADVVAVASRDGERARAYADEHGISRAHASYGALLADPEVDAIYVSLPNDGHVPWSIRALEAGKHVLSEKPLTRHAAAAEAAFDAARRAGRLLTEAFMWRHHPQTRRLQALVADGAVGELRLIRAAFSFVIAPGDVRLDPALDGGGLMDVGCYCVSAMRLLAGEPGEVVGRQVLGGGGVDVRFTGLLRFERPGGEVLGVLDCGFDLARRAHLEVVGSDGRIVVEDPWAANRPGLALQRGDEVEPIAIAPADAYRLELEDLARAAATGGVPLLGREDAVGQARALEALYRSAETGGAVVPVVR